MTNNTQDDKVRSKSLEDGNELEFYNKIVTEKIPSPPPLENLPNFNFHELSHTVKPEMKTLFERYNRARSELVTNLKTYLSDGLDNIRVTFPSEREIKIHTNTIYPSLFGLMDTLECEWWITGETCNENNELKLCINIIMGD